MKRTSVFSVGFLLVGFLALAAGGVASRPERSTPGAATRSAGPGGALPPQLVRVFVHEFDLYPPVIHLTPGEIVLRAENEKRVRISLVVEAVKEGGIRLEAARLNAGGSARRAAQNLVLEAGEYEFYEESNPIVRGRLIVE
jgi:hypothetical protein